MPSILLTNEQAEAAIRNRLPTGTNLNSRQLADSWDDDARAKAFFSSRVAQADILAGFQRRIQQVVEGKISQGEAREWMRQLIESKGDNVLAQMGFKGAQAGKSGGITELASTSRLNLIIDQNVTMAHQAAAYQQAQDDLEFYPYVEYISQDDGRVRPSHAALHGKIFKADSDEAALCWPPNGFRCRCRMRRLHAHEVKGRKIESGIPAAYLEKKAQDTDTFSFDPRNQLPTAMQPRETWAPEVAKAYSEGVKSDIDVEIAFMEKRRQAWLKEFERAKKPSYKAETLQAVASIDDRLANLKKQKQDMDTLANTSQDNANKKAKEAADKAAVKAAEEARMKAAEEKWAIAAAKQLAWEQAKAAAEAKRLEAEAIKKAEEKAIADEKAKHLMNLASTPSISIENMRKIDMEGFPGWEKDGVKRSYGGVIVGDDGRILLREPKDHYDNYVWTFPKGGGQHGQHPVDTAIKEIGEETGHKGQVIGVLNGGFQGGTSKVNLFIMRSSGHEPPLMDNETKSTKWVTFDEAAEHINQTTNSTGRKRDLAILQAAKEEIERLGKGQQNPALIAALKKIDDDAAAEAVKAAQKIEDAAKAKAAIKEEKAKAAAALAADAKAVEMGVAVIKKNVGGSQGAWEGEDSAGTRWFIKNYTDNDPKEGLQRMQVEQITAQLYQKAGIDVPKTMVAEVNGKTSILSKKISGVVGNMGTGAKMKAAADAPEIKNGFVVDAWLANWDTAGLEGDNIVMDDKGRYHRLDFGGGLMFKATGKRKTDSAGNSLFTKEVNELENMRSPTKNPNGSVIYGKLTDAEIIAQIRSLEKSVSLKDIKKIVKDSKINASDAKEIEEKLSARLDYLKAWADKVNAKKEDDGNPVSGRKLTSTPPVKRGVTKEEAIMITNARQNGAAIPTDGDQIEDQNVLIWHRKIKEKETISAKFKIREHVNLQVLNSQEWVEKNGTFKLSSIEKGNSSETSASSNYNMKIKQLTTKINGADVKFFPYDNDVPFTLRGTVFIDSKKDDVNNIFNLIEKLGVNADRSTEKDREELYLTRIAYHRKEKWDEFKKDTFAGTQDERIKKKKEFISSLIGADISKLSEYNPGGEMQAYNTGNVVQMRPDLVGEEWDTFKKEYRLKHSITNGGIVDSIDKILNSGGMFTPTADKLRRGIPVGGMSPNEDMKTGGADYFFTRITEEKHTKKTSGIIWKADNIARLDSISYSSDYFGKTNDGENGIQKRRKSGVSEWIEAAKNSSNETIFKGGVSLFDNLDKIIVESQHQKTEMINIFKKHGYQKFPDGRELNDVITVRI